MNDKILCDECAHAEICKYREEYKKVYAAVANLKIGEALSNDAHSIRNVSDIPYIDVIVDCKHLRRSLNAAQRTAVTALPEQYLGIAQNAVHKRRTEVNTDERNARTTDTAVESIL